MMVGLKRFSNRVLDWDGALGWGCPQSQHPTPVSAPIPNHPHIFLHVKDLLQIVVVLQFYVQYEN